MSDYEILEKMIGNIAAERDALRDEVDRLGDRAIELYFSNKRLRGVLVAVRTAIHDTIRRPMGVEPDSATAALRLIEESLGEGGEE